MSIVSDNVAQGAEDGHKAWTQYADGRTCSLCPGGDRVGMLNHCKLEKEFKYTL